MSTQSCSLDDTDSRRVRWVRLWPIDVCEDRNFQAPEDAKACSTWINGDGECYVLIHSMSFDPVPENGVSPQLWLRPEDTEPESAPEPLQTTWRKREPLL
jgi:hypothetical protein